MHVWSDNVFLGEIKDPYPDLNSRLSLSNHVTVSPQGDIASRCGSVAVQPQVRQRWLCIRRARCWNTVTPMSRPRDACPGITAPLLWKPGYFTANTNTELCSLWQVKAKAKQTWNSRVTCPATAKPYLRTGLCPPSLTSELGSGTGKFWCPWPLFFYVLCWWLMTIFLTCPVQSL